MSKGERETTYWAYDHLSIGRRLSVNSLFNTLKPIFSISLLNYGHLVLMWWSAVLACLLVVAGGGAHAQGSRGELIHFARLMRLIQLL